VFKIEPSLLWMILWLIELGLWYLKLLSTIFQLYRWQKPEYPKKTTDLLQVTSQTLSHNVVSSSPRHEQGSNSNR
jgi:hypothetical protein